MGKEKKNRPERTKKIPTVEERDGVSYVKLESGRQLAVEITGDPNGYPIFLLHGSPGSKLGPKPRNLVLHGMKVKLITYDRPGYGGSTRHKDRTVADAAHDVEAIADAFGIDKFGVVGRSGGGPHALACAALLPDRVEKAAILVGLAPKDYAEWNSGMTADNTAIHDASSGNDDAEKEALRVRFATTASRSRRRPEVVLDNIEEDLTEADQYVLADSVKRRLTVQAHQDGLSSGGWGWYDDVMAFNKDWGFDLKKIKQPVFFWHGWLDKFAPPAHTLWLAKAVQNPVVKIDISRGHFGAIDVLSDILAWVNDP